MSILISILISLISIFLILVVLVQRGRGGGLAGALGGMGGQSAFGAKAGDVFTKITIVIATLWILLCVVAVKLVGGSSDPLNTGGGSAVNPYEGVPGMGPLGDEQGAAPGGAGMPETEDDFGSFPAPEGSAPAGGIAPEGPADEP